MMKKTITLIFLILIPLITNAVETAKVIEVQGKAFTIVKPDMAHFFIKVTGYGNSYEISMQQANSRIEDIKKIVIDIMGKAPDISVIKKENKPKDDLSDKNFMEMQQESMKTLAKAMKGEEPQDSEKNKKLEMTTNITIYFSSIDFSDDSILRIKSILAEKEIGFNKSDLFDRISDFGTNKSSILFGLKDPNRNLAALASEALNKAKNNAKIIAEASMKELGDLVRISGCGCDLRGNENTSEINDLLGHDLGPLSLDSNRLVVKYEKKYEFAIK